MVFPVVPAPVTLTPSRAFPEMTFRAAAVVPPTVLPDAPVSILMPSSELATAPVPAALVPIRFPTTRLPVVPAVRICTPETFPPMTLPAPAAVPPTVLFVAPLSIWTPLSAFPSAAVPAAFRPT